jgi:hypothetical protein
MDSGAGPNKNTKEVLNAMMSKKLMAFYAVSLATLGVTASKTLSPISVEAGGQCCNYSSDCNGTTLRYVPGGLAPCSSSQPNYCC